MGANSIDISQYRSRIGTFSRKKFPGKAYLGARIFGTLRTSTLKECFIVLSYLLVMSNVTQKLLIISGVELNPGPFTIGNKYYIHIINVETHLNFIILL